MFLFILGIVSGIIGVFVIASLFVAKWRGDYNLGLADAMFGFFMIAISAIMISSSDISKSGNINSIVKNVCGNVDPENFLLYLKENNIKLESGNIDSVCGAYKAEMINGYLGSLPSAAGCSGRGQDGKVSANGNFSIGGACE